MTDQTIQVLRNIHQDTLAIEQSAYKINEFTRNLRKEVQNILQHMDSFHHELGSIVKQINIENIYQMTVEELREELEYLGVSFPRKARKTDLQELLINTYKN